MMLDLTLMGVSQRHILRLHLQHHQHVRIVIDCSMRRFKWESRTLWCLTRTVKAFRYTMIQVQAIYCFRQQLKIQDQTYEWILMQSDHHIQVSLWSRIKISSIDESKVRNSSINLGWAISLSPQKVTKWFLKIKTEILIKPAARYSYSTFSKRQRNPID